MQWLQNNYDLEIQMGVNSLLVQFPTMSKYCSTWIQVHSRSFSVRSLRLLPQEEQIFDDGSKRLILMIFLPYYSALYANISTNIDHLQSDIDCMSLWFAS